jgi:hypothetical protein
MKGKNKSRQGERQLKKSVRETLLSSLKDSKLDGTVFPALKRWAIFTNQCLRWPYAFEYTVF